MAQFVIEASAKDFGKEADRYLDDHKKQLGDDADKHELEQARAALEAAERLIKGGHFGDEHVYVVVSSGRNGSAWPRGSGNIVDVRVESRATPQRAEPDPQTAKAALEESNRRAALESGLAQQTEVAPAGMRAEEIAAKRDVSVPQHQTVPPATGYGSPYMPGDTPQEIAARQDPGNLPQATPDETAKMAAKQDAEDAKAQRRAPRKRAAARKTTGTATRAQRAAAKKAAAAAPAVAPPTTPKSNA